MSRVYGAVNLQPDFEENFEDKDERELSRPSYHRPTPVSPLSPVPATHVDRKEGAIRKLKQDRGFGFIAGDDGVDYFFHWTGMEKTSTNFRNLEVQDRVSFVVTVGDKGPRAVQIRVKGLDL